MFSNERVGPRCAPGDLDWSQQAIDDVIVVHLAGELDLSIATEFESRLFDLAESGVAAGIVLDLSEVGFIDAHSIGLIVRAWTAAQVHGRTLRVDGLRGLPAQLFGLLNLEPTLVRPTGHHNARDTGADTPEMANRAEKAGPAGNADAAGVDAAGRAGIPWKIPERDAGRAERDTSGRAR
jgi:anti-anti-sigma factor